MYKAFLIKYGEIGVKGKNRFIFEDALVRQIKFSLKDVEGEFDVRRADGRIYVNALSDYDYDEVIESLTRVFGIVGICPVVQIEDNGSTYRIWLEDASSLEVKLGLMKDNNLAGTAAWKLGFETSDIWDLIQKYVN